MKKKIVLIATMSTLALALMPVNFVHAEDVSVGKTITLDGNKTEQYDFKAGSSTLDLHGNNITVADKSAIIVEPGASLTITDSSKSAGTIESDAASPSSKYNASIFVMEGATVTIDNVNVKAVDHSAIKNFGNLTINGGSFVLKAENGFPVIANGVSDGSYNPYQDDSGNALSISKTSRATLTVNSGTFNGSFNTTTGKDGDWKWNYGAGIHNYAQGDLKLKGGDFVDCFWGVKNEEGGTAYINGGNFNALPETRNVDHSYYGNGGTISNRGTLEILNGTFQAASGTDGLVLRQSLYGELAGDAFVYGGTFSGHVSGTAGYSNVYSGVFTDADKQVIPYISVNSTYTTTGDVTTVTATTIATINQNLYFDSTPYNMDFDYSISNVSGYAENALLQDASATGSDQVFNGVYVKDIKLTNSTNTSTISSLGFVLNDYNSALATTDAQKQSFKNKQKVATKTLMVNFDGVKFDDPGIYRYVITATTTGAVIDQTQSRYLDVWVKKNLAGDNKLVGMVLHSDEGLSVSGTPATEASKVGSFDAISSQKSLNLTIKHYADGKQASKLESYEYTVTFTGGIKGSTGTYTLAGATPVTFTFSSTDGSYTSTFKLNNGQSMVFKCLPDGIGYTAKVSDDSQKTMIAEGLTTRVNFEQDYSDIVATGEKGTASDDHTGETTADTAGQEIAVSAANATTSLYSIVDTNLTTNTTIGFTVYKDGTIPTGVILTVAPYAVLLVAGFFGLIIFMKKRKEEPEEE